MNSNHNTTRERDIVLETFAVELTLAAYRVVLRHGTGRTWLDLELDLWRVLTDTVQKWGREWPRAAGQSTAALCGGRDGLHPWRDARLPLSGE